MTIRSREDDDGDETTMVTKTTHYATAMTLNVPLLGKDKAFRQYPVDLIW